MVFRLESPTYQNHLFAKYDTLTTEYKTLENACEANRLKSLQVSSEVVNYIQENQQLKKQDKNI